MEKTLGNTTASQAKDNVKDIVSWGTEDLFKLISKASSQKEGWMKSTKAMEIGGVGCLVQVSTQQGSNVAEALQFIPDIHILEKRDDTGKTVARVLTYKNTKYEDEGCWYDLSGNKIEKITYSNYGGPIKGKRFK